MADMEAARERDPACDKYTQCILYFKGFQAIQCQRIAHWLWKKDRKVPCLSQVHLPNISQAALAADACKAFVLVLLPLLYFKVIPAHAACMVIAWACTAMCNARHVMASASLTGYGGNTARCHDYAECIYLEIVQHMQHVICKRMSCLCH